MAYPAKHWASALRAPSKASSTMAMETTAGSVNRAALGLRTA